jgi:hypothetical protein
LQIESTGLGIDHKQKKPNETSFVSICSSMQTLTFHRVKSIAKGGKTQDAFHLTQPVGSGSL